MRLLFLTPQRPFPPRQGTTIRNFNLIRQLAQRHTIDLLTFLAPGETLPDGGELRRLCRRIEAVHQPVRSLPRRAVDMAISRLPDMALRLESAEMHAWVDRWLADSDYDVVQAEGIEMAQYGLRASRRRGAGRPPAFVFDNHNCEYLLQQRNALTDLRQPRRWAAAAYSLVQWQKLRAYEAGVCRSADATVAVSEADRAALRRIVPGQAIEVVTNGIEMQEYPAERAAGPVSGQILVFTGKMDYRPNIDAVLWFGRQVLPLIQRQAPAVRFQIVGMNPHPRLDVLRSDPAIEITGAVEDTRPFIYGAAVYVIPMRVGGGTRFKALEAMACGRAIVSTSMGVEGIGVRDGQELRLGDTPKAFAQAVLEVLAGGDDRMQRLGRRARHFVEEQYDWRQIVPPLEALYAQLQERQ